MSWNRAIRWFTSAKTTVLLLCLLALLLLLNVVIPQAHVLGERAYSELVEASAWNRFVLVTLGFGRLPTSPVFLAALALFFLNLAAVLGSRIGPTFRRLSLRPRKEEGLKAWARMEESYRAPLPEGWGQRNVAETLLGYGFKVRKVGERTFWGVKHRMAPLGFLLFHLSFFLIFAGGILLYYTRFLGVGTLVEGQDFSGRYEEILREAPTGIRPQLRFRLEEVSTAFEAGEPVHLGAEFLFRQGASSAARSSRVNHPAEWGTSVILVEQAGLAPVLWLQDEAGFTRDRLALPVRTRSGPPTRAELDEGRLQLLVHTLPEGSEFPQRESFGIVKMRFQVVQNDEVAFDGELGAGDAAEFEGGRLVVEEFRYWLGFRVISERGGGVLIVGFTLGLIGLIWRLLWYRREVAVTWDEESLNLVGRSEYFSHRFERELAAILKTLKSGHGTASPTAED